MKARKSRLVAALVGVAAVTLALSSAFADFPLLGVVKGTALDVNGNTAADTIVYLIDADGNTVGSDEADPFNGEYAITAPAGDYKIFAKNTCGNGETEPAEVIPRKSTEVNVVAPVCP